MQINPCKINQLVLITVFLTAVGACHSGTSLGEESGIRYFDNEIVKREISSKSMQVFEIRPDRAVRITNCKNKESCQNPTFSSDGKEIIFTKFLNGYNEGPSEMIRLNISNIKEQKVIVPAEEFDHVNAPGSSWRKGVITYSSDDSESEREEIFIVDQSGRNKRQVTMHEDDSSFIEPSFSPDGLRIVFEKSICPVRNCNKNDFTRGSIWVVSAEGMGIEKLIGNTEFDYRLPNWSPTGNRILFQKRTYPLDEDDEPVWDIWAMDENGTNGINITFSSGYDTDASWSWDGNFIVYSSDFGGLVHPNIFMISSSGGGRPIRITTSPLKEDGAPSFFPNDQYIAFESHKTSSEDSPANIWLIEINP
ncbi:MAG: hypothetical protein GY777_28605 [Candidatus Brocadiaceae bacterium]|nr:hypothetical protein [Candidatus Brocadiaceae bacterium]